MRHPGHAGKSKQNVFLFKTSLLNDDMQRQVCVGIESEVQLVNSDYFWLCGELLNHKGIFGSKISFGV